MFPIDYRPDVSYRLLRRDERELLRAPLSEDDVRGVAAPTLLMTGERSPAYPLRLTDRLAELLPNVERVEIAGASHLMHEENAGAVNEAILGFLARHA